MLLTDELLKVNEVLVIIDSDFFSYNYLLFNTRDGSSIFPTMISICIKCAMRSAVRMS